MTTQNIYQALGELSPEIILKADPANKTIKPSAHRTSVWPKRSLIVALVCLFITVGILFIPNLTLPVKDASENAPNQNQSDAAQRPDVMYGLCVPVAGHYGTITMTAHDIEQKTVTFVFDKINDADGWGFGFDGYSSQEQSIVEVLTPLPENAPVSRDHIILSSKDILILTINGTVVEELPGAPGHYEVVIDYSGTDAIMDTRPERVLVIGFGLFTLEQ